MPASAQASEGVEKGNWAVRALLAGGATGALLQTFSFALVVSDRGSAIGAAAVLGTAISGLTLVGLVIWVVRRSLGAHAAVSLSRVEIVPPPSTAHPSEPQASEPRVAAATPTEEVPPVEQPAPAAPNARSVSGSFVKPASLEEIAHDINDLMTVVVTQAELLRERSAGRMTTEFEPILEAASRLSGVARRLVAFAERQRFESPASARSALIGPGIARAKRESAPAARDSMPSILDAVEGVRDADSVVRESHPTLSERRPARGSLGVILLVEDEEVLLKATRRMLEQRGFRVLAAGDGARALDLALAEGAIDVLVTDLSLPGMDGKELARRLRWSMPGLAVLFMSGYDAITSGLALGTGGRDAFLPKPFTARELSERLAELCGPAEREALAQPG